MKTDLENKALQGGLGTPTTEVKRQCDVEAEQRIPIKAAEAKKRAEAMKKEDEKK